MAHIDVTEFANLVRPDEAKSQPRAQVPQPSDLPATVELLTQGGDARIAPENDGIKNKYGCQPFPDPALLSFGSSTASVISESAFAAADRLRDRISQSVGHEAPEGIYARELNRIRSELTVLCGVADLPDLNVVFAASGTDLHLIASQLIGGTQSCGTRIIMVGAEETGSCVPAALSGTHFSTRSSLGREVDEGLSIGGGKTIDLSAVPIRTADGSVRPIADIDHDVESLVTEAVAMQLHVLLILVDVSKTGMIAPSPACAAKLHHRLAQSVDVLVDACQFRISPATVRAYLQQGFMVALTGSKFVGGPTFSGALLLPAPITHRFIKQPLSRALSAYSARADWPDHWTSADILDNVANFGLLLRWEAALEELRAFIAIPGSEVAAFLQAFGTAVRQRLQDSPFFEPLAVPPLDRAPFNNQNIWDRCQTIFPFMLYLPTINFARTPLNREETLRIYHLLQADRGDHLRFQLGQPVACGNRNDIPLSALRICASARLVVEGCAQDGKNAAAVIDSALVALDKTAILIETGQFQN